MLFASLFSVCLIVNLKPLRNFPNRIINTISVHFFNSFTYCAFYPLGTIFGSFIAIFTIFANLRNNSSAFPVFVDVYTNSPIYPPPFTLNRIYILFR
jgi:hypothetical protein